MVALFDGLYVAHPVRATVISIDEYGSLNAMIVLYVCPRQVSNPNNTVLHVGAPGKQHG